MAKKKKTTTTPRRDIRAQVSDKLAAAIAETIQKGEATGEWQMPWAREGMTLAPVNGTTGAAYRGVNILILLMRAQELGATSSKWATYKQWQAAGRQVAKGSKGEQIVFYKKIEVDDKKAKEAGKADATKFVPMLRSFTVFNECQLEGYTAPAEIVEEKKGDVEALAHVEAFVANTKAHIKNGGDRAFYAPAQDFIGMPPRDKFRSTEARSATEAYYGTLLHELTHWTGAEHRLNRIKPQNLNKVKEGYAFEELVAELGCCFLTMEFGVATELREDHIQYLRHWLGHLKSDTDYIFKAAARAQDAVEYLHSLQPEVLEETVTA